MLSHSGPKVQRMFRAGRNVTRMFRHDTICAIVSISFSFSPCVYVHVHVLKGILLNKLAKFRTDVNMNHEHEQFLNSDIGTGIATRHLALKVKL
jgi:hypothetical protein